MRMMATDEHIDDQGEDVLVAAGMYVARSKQSMEGRDDAPVHRQLTSRCGKMCGEWSRCVTKLVQLHAPWCPSGLPMGKVAGTRPGKTSKRRRTHGVQQPRHRTPALHGHDTRRPAVPGVGSLGRSGPAVLEPCGPTPHGPAGTELWAPAPRPVHALHLLGLPVAAQACGRALPLARRAPRAASHATVHAPLATLAHSPRLRRRLCGRGS
jgi:hypothetical protein